MEKFIDELLRLRGSASMPPGVVAEYRARFARELTERLSDALMAALPDRARYGFIEAERQGSDASTNYLRQHVPNWEQVMSATFAGYKREFLSEKEISRTIRVTFRIWNNEWLGKLFTRIFAWRMLRATGDRTTPLNGLVERIEGELTKVWVNHLPAPLMAGLELYLR
jgi:hypothetical protein